MLKISSQDLERFQNYGHLTEKFWQLPAYVCKNWPISSMQKLGTPLMTIIVEKKF